MKRHRQPLIAMGQESMGCGEMPKDRGKGLSDCVGESIGCGKTLMGLGGRDVELRERPIGCSETPNVMEGRQ